MGRLSAGRDLLSPKSGRGFGIVLKIVICGGTPHPKYVPYIPTRSGREEVLDRVAGGSNDVERYAGVVCGGHRIRVWHDGQQYVPKDWRL